MIKTVSFTKDDYQNSTKFFSISRLKSILPHNALKDSEDDVEIILSEDSTIIDEHIIKDVLENFRGSSVCVRFNGGVDGTVPLKIKINGGSEEKVYYVDDQGLRGVNCTISRPLREKIFNKIICNFPDLVNFNFPSFVELLKSESVRDIALTYGEPDKKLHKIDSCPICSSSFTTPLSLGEGNTITGFLESSHKVYHHCNLCSYVFLSLQVSKKNLKIFYSKEVYGRSKSKLEILEDWNNLSEATSSHFGNYLIGLKQIKSTEKILDLGCGSGDFLSIVRDNRPDAILQGIDFFIPSPIIDAYRDKNIHGESIDLIKFVQDCDKSNQFDVITMWEVIEHLKIEDLRLLLKSFRDILRPNGRLIFSTLDFHDDHSKSLDFWAMASGEHLSVFNLNVCRGLLNEAGFEVHEFERESVTTKLPGRWYEYGSSTNTTQSGRSSAAIIESFLSHEKLREEFKDLNRKAKIGSELIVTAVLT